MKNPAMIIPDAGQAIGALVATLRSAGLPEATGNLVHLRVSQINGCSACADGGARTAQKAGESAERLFAVAAWREAPYFTDAERAALALAEAVTRLSDRSDPVPDAIWAEAARHYTEQQLAALVLWIATANLFNRLNAPDEAGRRCLALNADVTSRWLGSVIRANNEQISTLPILECTATLSCACTALW